MIWAAVGAVLGVVAVRLFDRARWVVHQMQFEKRRQEILAEAARDAAEFDERMGSVPMGAYPWPPRED